jgi:hypothetical protein
MPRIYEEFGHLVYELTTPDGASKYVGQTTTTLAERLAGHIRGARRAEARGDREAESSQWIRDLLAAGLEPQIRLLATADAETLSKVEREWISRRWQEGALLENRDGTRGRRPSRKRARHYSRKHRVGDRIGRLTLEEFLRDDPGRFPRYHARCDCGHEVSVDQHYLSRAKYPSCGCWAKEELVKRMRAKEPWNKGKKTGPLSEEHKATLRTAHARRKADARKAAARSTDMGSSTWRSGVCSQMIAPRSAS